MNKLIPVFFAATLLIIFSCEKEYSLENSGNISGNGQIVGADCRISKIAVNDTTAAGTGIGALTATLNAADDAINITKFDSLSLVIEYIATPTYAGDTVYINANEYFLVSAVAKRVYQLHALIDPTDPFSVQYDVSYFYDAAGYLVNKFYTLTSIPGSPYYQVNYTYSGGKLTKMTATDLLTSDLITNADITYFSNILPKNFIYIFPDELRNPYLNQFYNFGQKPTHALKSMLVRNYDPGNVLRDSTSSSFSNYMLSRDNYVLSVIMGGDDQITIPAAAGKLSFSYICR